MTAVINPWRELDAGEVQSDTDTISVWDRFVDESARLSFANEGNSCALVNELTPSQHGVTREEQRETCSLVELQAALPNFPDCSLAGEASHCLICLFSTLLQRARLVDKCLDKVVGAFSLPMIYSMYCISRPRTSSSCRIARLPDMIFKGPQAGYESQMTETNHFNPKLPWRQIY